MLACVCSTMRQVESKPYSLLNPLTGTNTMHTEEELNAVAEVDNSWDPTTRPISQEVTEAVVVLFDASGSMNEPAFGPGDGTAFSPSGWVPPTARCVRDRGPCGFWGADCRVDGVRAWVWFVRGQLRAQSTLSISHSTSKATFFVPLTKRILLC